MSRGRRQREARLIEDPLVEYAESLGYLAWKFTSPNTVGVPDRLIVSPWGFIFFMECKAPGEEVEPGSPQERRIKDLTSRGVMVAVVDNVDEGKALLDTFATEEGYQRYVAQLVYEAQQEHQRAEDAKPRIITPVPRTRH